MRTRNHSVMILKQPLKKWDPENRATEHDPVIRNANGDLMTNKLYQILHDHKERVALSNALVFELLQEYRKKSRRLKSAERQIKSTRTLCSGLKSQKECLMEHISELETENERLKTENMRLSKRKNHSHS